MAFEDWKKTEGEKQTATAVESNSGLSWVSEAALGAYRDARSAMPVEEPYKDLALAGTAVLGLASATLVARKAMVSESLQIVGKEVSIVPLTKENLPKAVAAANDGFRYGWPILHPARDFKASLNPAVNAKRLAHVSDDFKIELNARYWVAKDKNGNVFGTTGLYETGRDQSEAAWLGWMSVRNNARGLGIGRKLVEFSEEQAKADGKQFLRLYTSTSKGEAAAQVLYEKLGYKIVERTPHSLPRFIQRLAGEKQPLEILLREKRL